MVIGWLTLLIITSKPINNTFNNIGVNKMKILNETNIINYMQNVYMYSDEQINEIKENFECFFDCLESWEVVSIKNNQ